MTTLRSMTKEYTYRSDTGTTYVDAEDADEAARRIAEIEGFDPAVQTSADLRHAVDLCGVPATFLVGGEVIWTAAGY